MGDSVDGGETAASLRMQLDDARSRIEHLRRQQSEAKAKAKAVIQKQRQQARLQVETLENEKKQQAEELSAVKDLLRNADATRESVSQEKEALQVVLDQGKQDMEKIALEREDMQRAWLEKAAEKEALEKNFISERGEMQARIVELEQKCTVEASVQRETSDEAVINACESRKGDLNIKLIAEKERSEKLEQTCGQLREEISSLRVSPDAAEEAIQVKGSEEVDRNTEELQNAKARVEELSNETERLRERMRKMERDHEEGLQTASLKTKEFENELAKSEKLVKLLRADLDKSEAALQKEREAVSNLERKMTESTNSSDGNTILEAKIAEMERLVASKQADIVKTREKAKSYLKDINAEKREFEEKKKNEVEALQRELEAEQDKVKAADQRTDNVSTELDNCLALIREKQKNVQVLRMSVSSEHKAAEEAQKAVKAVQAEFAAYKERAKMALQEKETSKAECGGDSEIAMKRIQAELDRTRKEVVVLKRQLAVLKAIETRLQEMTERAEKAEAVADLLRSDSSTVRSANYSQIDVLEEKMASLEIELRTAQAATEDAEAQHETTKMRLESAERALRATELRGDEAQRHSAKVVEDLRKQVWDLKKEVEKAKEFSAAAQRTAAVAARALAFGDPKENTVNNGMSDKKAGISSEAQANRGNGVLADSSPYNSAQSLGAGRSTLAVAMEGHSESLGLGVQEGNSGHAVHRFAEDEDLLARDKQIKVLSAQVAELGALQDETQQEMSLKSEQTEVLKAEIKRLDAKLAAAEKLKNGAPFSYLRTIVVRFLETDDPTLLPVIANVLSFTEDESSRVKAHRGSTTPTSMHPGSSPRSSYFSLPFLGSR